MGAQDATNLVYRAAELILRESGQPRPVRLTLVKNIPAGSGLGSASSDAAATLLGLNQYLAWAWPGTGWGRWPPGSAATSPSFWAVRSPIVRAGAKKSRNSVTISRLRPC